MGVGTTKSRMALVACCAFLVFAAKPVLGQSDSTTTQSSPTTSTDSGVAQNAPPASTDSGAPVPAASGGFFIRALNSANPLSDEGSPLHWGWFSVQNIEFREYFSRTTIDTLDAGPQTQDDKISRFSTVISIERKSPNLSFALQYQPDLFIVNGKVYTNSSNQQLSLDSTRRLSDRWTLQLRDSFTYIGQQRNFAGLSLDANYSTGGVINQSFVDGAGSSLYNSLGAGFTYAYSPRTSISFSPTFGYQRTTGLAGLTAKVSDYLAGGIFGWSYLLSPTRTIGVSYTGQYAFYNNTTVDSGPQGNQFTQDALVNYGQQLSEYWHFNGSLGIATNNGSSQNGNSLALGAGISRKFNHSDYAVNYYRGHSFNGYITSGSTERVDVAQHVYWTPRITTALSGSYFHSVQSSPKISGLYATGELNFLLTRRLGVFGSYSYVKQVGDDVYILTAKRNQFTTGIRWTGPISGQN